MIGVLSAIWWLLEHWWLLAYVAFVLAAYVAGGWRLALAVGSLGAGYRVYQHGREKGRAEIERQEQARRDYLEESYDKISSRPLDPGDAYRRLLDRSRGR